ncbi:MAG: hypothetical protein IPL92_18000 [Saprospiraceae bacterium]|nr:hypothetical protein [Candidatus Opimibacter iunctus]
MLNNLAKLCFAFIVLLFIPILWSNKIEFNFAIFTTEYYKFLFNTFIVASIAMYFKNQTDIISKLREIKIIRSNIKDKKYILLQSIQTKDLVVLKNSWKFIYANRKHIDSKINFKMINTNIKKINNINFEEKIESKEFTNIINTIKNEI